MHLKSVRNVLIRLILVLFILEIVSRWAVKNEWVLATTSRLSSTWWYLKWINSTEELTNGTGFEVDVFDPLLGWNTIQGVHDIEFNGKLYSFNSMGIRGKKEYSKEKSENKTRIITIGDSFTYGEEVSDNETYSAQLEEIMPNTEVLNMGVHGYAIDQMTLKLEKEGFDFNPDIVIYALIDDDINRATQNFRDYMKPKYSYKNNELKLTNVPIVPPEKLLEKNKKRLVLFDFAKLLYDRLTLDEISWEEREEIARPIWKKTADDIKAHKAIPVFLYLPAHDEMIDTSEDLRDLEPALFAFCETEKISCFSARKYLAEAYKKGVRYNLNSHYEPHTNRIVAEGLAKDLSEIFLPK